MGTKGGVQRLRTMRPGTLQGVETRGRGLGRRTKGCIPGGEDQGSDWTTQLGPVGADEGPRDHVVGARGKEPGANVLRPGKGSGVIACNVETWVSDTLWNPENTLPKLQRLAPKMFPS